MVRPLLGRRGPAPPPRGTAAENPPPSPGPFPDPAARTPRCTARIQAASTMTRTTSPRSEEHMSELQSRGHLVCRLLLEKKKDEKQDIAATREQADIARQAYRVHG